MRQHQQASEPGGPWDGPAQCLIAFEQHQDLLDDRPDVDLVEIEVVEDPMVLQAGDPTETCTLLQQLGRRKPGVEVAVVVDDRNARTRRTVAARDAGDLGVHRPQALGARNERVLRQDLDVDQAASTGSALAAWAPFCCRLSCHAALPCDND
jgi:hypothetical protein